MSKLPRVNPGDMMTAEFFNEVLDALESADDKAQKATRLLWFSIALTLVDIALLVWGAW